jgi:hypothetical protein
MYGFKKYPLEAVRGKAPEYVAIGHVGHGINSYAITYHLVYGPVACFVQSGWGGVYMDRDIATTKTKALLKKCSRVAKLAEHSSLIGRLLVMESEFSEVMLCEWLPPRLGGSASKAWLETHSNLTTDPLVTAVRLLRPN